MSRATDVKSDRLYTKDHEWALESGTEVLVGITAFAVDQLGDITLVNIDVKAGQTVEAHKAFGTIESVKTLSDLFCPISGTIVRVNPALENSPEVINEDPWQKGWMIAIAPSRLAEERSTLLNPTAYSELLSQSDH